MSDKVVVDGILSLTTHLDGEAGIVTKVRESALPAYTGATTVTPSDAAIVLSTAEKTVYQDIVINPIPSNYGLITQIGTYIRVS